MTAQTTDARSGQTAEQNNEAFSATEAADRDQLQLVSFVVGKEEFAISILSVQEINRMMKITRVPHSPEFIEGVINLRGRIIPVMDLRKRFGLEALEDTSDARIIVVDVAGRVIGFTVDRVNEVLRIDAQIVEPPPTMVSSVDTEFIQGVGKLDDRLLILLDLERLFSGEELRQVDETANRAA